MGMRRPRVIHFEEDIPSDPEEETWEQGRKRKKTIQKRRSKQSASSDGRMLSNFPNTQIELTQEITSAADLTSEELLRNLEALPEVRTGGTSQNDYLREWVSHRELYLNTLLSMKAPEEISNCMRCNNRPGSWRCRTCYGARIVCQQCCRETHQAAPFHRVDKWNGRYFSRAALWQAGVVLHLGHSGNPCHSPANPTDTEMEADPASEEDEWEDMDDETVVEPEEGQDPVYVIQQSDTHPKTIPLPPAYDVHGYPFVTIVDTSGIHHLPVNPCKCNSTESIDIQYLRLRLFPSSFKRIRTVFTFDLLTDYRLSNLECKTSGYQYYQKLRRLTSLSFPKLVMNRYRELRRVSRQYRNLKLHKIYGRAYNLSTLPHVPPTSTNTDGSEEQPQSPNQLLTPLGLFCAACPQPGINIPDDWEQDPNPDLYICSLVGDGNFKAYHLSQKNALDDVHLATGEGYMTDPVKYQEHLVEASKNPDLYARKPTCNNHNANKDSDKSAPGKRCRGVGAWACARHGCFALGSVVDFMKGEKQMSMDYALCQAIKTGNMGRIRRLLGIYDIMCQYFINLLERIRKSSKLKLPDDMTIIGAIGLFHVHGHKEECLYRWATTYIHGVGIIDGEILETLWSVLNEVSRSTVGATAAHRIEILDDHMGDNNWKKIINMAESVAKRYKRAVLQQEKAQQYFDGISSSAPADQIPKWTEQIQKAENSRQEDVTVMDVMKNTITKAPSRKDIELAISLQELTSGGSTGKAAWLSNGVKLEENLYNLRAYSRNMPKKPTTTQQLELAAKRRTALKQKESFLSLAVEFLGGKLVDLIDDPDLVILDEDLSGDNGPITESPSDEISHLDLERQPLPFPSRLASSVIAKLSPVDRDKVLALRKIELQIRRGQAEDSLDHVRTAVIQLSYHYAKNVCGRRSVVQNTRAWDGVKILNRVVSQHRIVYNHNRDVMRTLVPPETLPIQDREFPLLERHHCRVSERVVDPNAPGQSSDSMSWLWHSDRNTTGAPAGLQANPGYYNEFYRVNWLSARAQRNRWNEELALTRHEMDWTIRFYIYMVNSWKSRRDSTQRAGHRAYAEEQMDMWSELAQVAEVRFSKIQVGYQSPITLPSFNSS